MIKQSPFLLLFREDRKKSGADGENGGIIFGENRGCRAANPLMPREKCPSVPRALFILNEG